MSGYRGDRIAKTPSIDSLRHYGIALEYRPVAQPHTGGHIERLLGTLLRALHELPGATFSNPVHRGRYDSEACAVMTLDEIEQWLTDYIVCVYHV